MMTVELFRSTWQQDAHEMFNYCINHFAETLVTQAKEIGDKLNTIDPPPATGRASRQEIEGENAESAEKGIKS
jgi:hypothetical protein